MTTQRARFEVQRHSHGRPIVQRGPAAGCVGFPEHRWVRLTPRPVGFARARALADAEGGHAVALHWMTSVVAYDNGKPATLPEGWRPAEAND